MGIRPSRAEPERRNSSVEDRAERIEPTQSTYRWDGTRTEVVDPDPYHVLTSRRSRSIGNLLPPSSEYRITDENSGLCGQDQSVPSLAPPIINESSDRQLNGDRAFGISTVIPI